MQDHYPIVIVGGGSAGITVAVLLANEPKPPAMAIIEPSTTHYYQPLWTLVGGGVFPQEVSERDEADFIPSGATWLQDAVATFAPAQRTVTTVDGKVIGYDFLVVAAGLQLNWDAIPGLKESVGQPGTGVCSNYAYATVASTWENLRTLQSGVAVFTQPNPPIKCGGAPQKICYLADDYFRRAGVRDRIDMIFCSAEPHIFAVDKYAKTLHKVMARKHIETRFRHHLVALRPGQREADFAQLDSGEIATL